MPEIFTVIKGRSGKVSMMRIATLIIVASIMGVFVGHNILAMIKGGGFISIGPEEAMLITGVLGAKAAQAFSEKKQGATDGLPIGKTE